MVTAALEKVGIAHLRHKVCHHLSGGEKRKVALAGALVLEPELLVLDEPFEGLDPSSRSDLVELLNRLHREQGVSLVMATHDINVVPIMADRVYVLVGGGEIVAQGPPREIFQDPGLLRRSNVEPPVLAELFQRLEERGVALGRPVTVEEAARAILAWTAKHPPCEGDGDLGPLFRPGGAKEKSVAAGAPPEPPVTDGSVPGPVPGDPEQA